MTRHFYLLSYRDGENGTIEHDHGNDGAFYFAPSNYSVTIQNHSSLTVQDSRLIGPVGRNPTFTFCGAPTQDMLTVESSSSVQIRNNTLVVGTVLDSDTTKTTYCGGSGIKCSGKHSTLFLRGDNIWIQGGIVDAYIPTEKKASVYWDNLDRSKTKKTKLVEPGNGIVLSDACRLVVESGKNVSVQGGKLNYPSHHYDEDKVEAPSLVGARGLVLRKNTEAIIHDGNFAGSSGIYAYSNASLTIFNGRFVNARYWRREHGTNPRKDWNSAVYMSPDANLTIHGGVYEDVVRDDYSSSLYMDRANVHIYGGDYHGRWYFPRHRLPETANVTVYGENLNLSHRSNTFLSGVLCDGSEVAVELHGVNSSLLITAVNFVSDCRGYVHMEASEKYTFSSHSMSSGDFEYSKIFVFTAVLLTVVLSVVMDSKVCLRIKKVLLRARGTEFATPDIELKALRSPE